MTGLDLSTAAGALALAERRRGEMARCFERLGRFESAYGNSFGALALLTHDVRMPVDPRRECVTGKRLGRVEAVPFDLPRLMTALLPPNMHSKVFADELRKFCKVGRAVGVLVMSEQWHGRTSSMEERAARPPRIEDWDDRREALLMRLEHQATGGRTWRAWIRRNPTRLEPWEDYPGAVAGNLINILEQKEWQS